MNTAILLSLSLLPLAGPTLRLAEGGVVIDAEVNGKPLSLLLDTGYTGWVAVDSSVDIGRSTGTTSVRDFVGQTEVPVVPLRSMKVAGRALDVGGEEAIRKPLKHLAEVYGERVQGVMGLQPFLDGPVTFDWRAGSIAFGARRVGHEVRLLPIGLHSLEVRLDTPGGPLTLGLDTGNTEYLVTHRESLERVGLWPADATPRWLRAARVATGPLTTWQTFVPSTQLGPEELPPSVWTIIELPSSQAQADGTIGFGLLSRFRFTVDFPARRVWLDPYEPDELGNPVVGEVGLSVGRDAKTGEVRVAALVQGGPAERAGLRPRTPILSIDGGDPWANRGRLRGEIGGSVVVEWQGGKATLPLQPLVNGWPPRIGP